jgi:outer membrane lipoprotein-sorting protein
VESVRNAQSLNRQLIVVCSVVLWCANMAIAQTRPEGIDLLKRVSAVYRGVSQYEVEVSADDRLEGNSTLMRIKFRSPDKYRIETIMQLRSSAADRSTSISALMGFDGSTWWGYRPDLGIYSTGKPVSLDADAMGIGPFRDLLGTFDKQGGRNMRVSGEDRLVTADGKERQCFVVELTYPQDTTRLWIEKGTYHVLRMEEMGSTITFNKIELGVQFSEDVFRFVPPAGARKVDRLP